MCGIRYSTLNIIVSKVIIDQQFVYLISINMAVNFPIKLDEQEFGSHATNSVMLKILNVNAVALLLPVLMLKLFVLMFKLFYFPEMCPESNFFNSQPYVINSKYTPNYREKRGFRAPGRTNDTINTAYSNSKNSPERLLSDLAHRTAAILSSFGSIAVAHGKPYACRSCRTFTSPRTSHAHQLYNLMQFIHSFRRARPPITRNEPLCTN